MRKGRSLARLTAGMVVVAVAAACGGGDAPEAGGEDAAPAATTPAQTPGTAAPGGDPTTAVTTDTGGAAAPAAGDAAGGEADLVAQGQQIYSSSICVSCHGPAGDGTPLAPSLTDSEWLWVDTSGDMRAQVATIIRTGVSQPKDPAHVAPMLPYGGGPPLEEAQVEALAAYVVSLAE